MVIEPLLESGRKLCTGDDYNRSSLNTVSSLSKRTIKSDVQTLAVIILELIAFFVGSEKSDCGLCKNMYSSCYPV